MIDYCCFMAFECGDVKLREARSVINSDVKTSLANKALKCTVDRSSNQVVAMSLRCISMRRAANPWRTEEVDVDPGKQLQPCAFPTELETPPDST